MLILVPNDASRRALSNGVNDFCRWVLKFSRRRQFILKKPLFSGISQKIDILTMKTASECYETITDRKISVFRSILDIDNLPSIFGRLVPDLLKKPDSTPCSKQNPLIWARNFNRRSISLVPKIFSHQITSENNHLIELHLKKFFSKFIFFQEFFHKI